MQAVTQIRWVSRPWDDPCAHHSTWFLAESQGDQALRLGVRGLTPDHSQEHKPGHQVVVGGSRFLHGLGDLGVHSIRVGGGAAAPGHCWPCGPGHLGHWVDEVCLLLGFDLHNILVAQFPTTLCANAGPVCCPQDEPGAQGEV